jgi:tyrosine-protein phosphatase
MGRGPPASLRIHTPKAALAVQLEDGSANSAIDSADDSDFISSFHHPPPQKARSLRNLKKLSLNLPSAHSSATSLQLPAQQEQPVNAQSEPPRLRRPSIISLPATSSPAPIGLYRKEEDGSPTIPYIDGPIQILPGIWLGSEDNARDWVGLMERGIKSILNVAKEVVSPFDIHSSTPLRQFASVPNLKLSSSPESEGEYHPPHPASGRPGLHYLKLPWSHGQQDLVDNGFPAAIKFTDSATRERGEGVLIHCQCGISRSATLIIALVMRAAAERSASVPPEVWDLKGMQGAYSFVKSKSRWAGPNMSLIYQLLEYERRLDPCNHPRSPSTSGSSLAEEEEEWGRQRRLLDEQPSDAESNDPQTRDADVIREEARALDKAMEDRIVARKSSNGSLAPSFTSSTGVGMGAAWRSRYGNSGRKRTGSVASNLTTGSHSIISEDLMEEEEEQDLGFDTDSKRAPSASNLSSRQTSPSSAAAPLPTAQLQPPPIHRRRLTSTASRSSASSVSSVPPSAPVWKTSFHLPPPPKTAARSTFDLPPVPSRKAGFGRPPSLSGSTGSKRRPLPLGILPPVPSSPIAIVTNESEPSSPTGQPSLHSLSESAKQRQSLPPITPTPQRIRTRTESRTPAPPPPLHLIQSNTVPPKTPSLRGLAHSHSSSHSIGLSSTDLAASSRSTSRTHSRKSSLSNDASRTIAQHPHTHHVTSLSQPPPTATQTLFVFPPSPSKSGMKTPSTMTLVSTPMPGIPFPTLSQSGKGERSKRRSWISSGAAIPPTPTTACSRVDARGWVGLP